MLNQIKNSSEELSELLSAALLHGKDLVLQQDNLKLIKQNDILLFSVMKNEAFRLSFYIDYYRKLGVNHFIFVNNGSTDHFAAIIADQSDITTFYTEASYKESNYGMHWCNDLLRRYGTDHWCLTCDPDEFLVYPYMDTRKLRDLTEYLDSLNEVSISTMMVDMYSDCKITESYYREGSSPLQVCEYFDGTGYFKEFIGKHDNFFMFGGVRQRIFYKENPIKAPALNKVSLIKWQKNYAYVESMHMALPKFINHVLSKSKTTAALLHFKFINQLAEKVKEEVIAQQHWENSAEYKKYLQLIDTEILLYDSTKSVRYKDWRSLVQLGLMNLGEW
jgi:hypothetical protein